MRWPLRLRLLEHSAPNPHDLSDLGAGDTFPPREFGLGPDLAGIELTPPLLGFVEKLDHHGCLRRPWGSEFCKRKIRGSRGRDKSNFAKLRTRGWNVIRLWQHEVERDPAVCIKRAVAAASGK
ncbi:MAG: hypothetical protein C0404_10235 [Verrucomicrobia bacterium]|nr:hypothetical protein [Verrucomicrobiota bacterium]